MNFDEKLPFLRSGKTLQNGDLFSSTDKMPQNFLSCCPNSGKKKIYLNCNTCAGTRNKSECQGSFIFMFPI